MFLEDLRSALSTPLRPKVISDGSYKLASVLVVVYGKVPTVLMTEKPKYMRFHAGEISFPGGKLEPTDSDLLETAIRETREEIGLTLSQKNVIGQLEPVITLNSGFLILPFVSVIDSVPSLHPNAEVKRILHIRLKSFLETMKVDPDPLHNVVEEMHTFEYGRKTVWGASARILKQVQDSLNRKGLD